jgi:hypothetical protein
MREYKRLSGNVNEFTSDLCGTGRRNKIATVEVKMCRARTLPCRNALQPGCADYRVCGRRRITRIGIYRSYLLSVLEDEASGPG